MSAVRRCRFCHDRLDWSYEDQEWIHRSTADVQAADGHYPDVRVQRWPTILAWALIVIMLLLIGSWVVDRFI